MLLDPPYDLQIENIFHSPPPLLKRTNTFSVVPKRCKHFIFDTGCLPIDSDLLATHDLALYIKATMGPCYVTS